MLGKKGVQLVGAGRFGLVVPNQISPSHPPAALPLGTCLWKPTGLPSLSLQMLQTLGHYRKQGQVANLHNTHITVRLPVRDAWSVLTRAFNNVTIMMSEPKIILSFVNGAGIIKGE